MCTFPSCRRHKHKTRVLGEYVIFTTRSYHHRSLIAPVTARSTTASSHTSKSTVNFENYKLPYVISKQEGQNQNQIKYFWKNEGEKLVTTTQEGISTRCSQILNSIIL